MGYSIGADAETGGEGSVPVWADTAPMRSGVRVAGTAEANNPESGWDRVQSIWQYLLNILVQQGKGQLLFNLFHFSLCVLAIYLYENDLYY